MLIKTGIRLTIKNILPEPEKMDETTDTIGFSKEKRKKRNYDRQYFCMGLVGWLLNVPLDTL